MAQGAEAEMASQWPTAPLYNFSSAPRPKATIAAASLSSAIFFRNARWTPDCTAVLTTAEDHVVRVLGADLSPSLESRQPDAVHAAVWHPAASASTPEAFCFAASVRDTPVRLVDAADGRIRASYPIVDHRERFIAPHSLAFNVGADKLYCGFENAIEVVDVASPGYDNHERLKTNVTRRDKGGQKGIISALSFSQHNVGTYAAGSFNGSVVLYDEDTGARAAAHLDGVVGGGVTQLAYHPLDGNTLFVASRRSNALQVFDLRDTSAPVARLERSANTNQRIEFGLDPWGRYLASGDENGTLRVWDISDGAFTLLLEDKLHEDALHSVQLHPYKPLVLTAAGSRAYLQNTVDDASSDEFDSDSESDGGDDELLAPTTQRKPPDTRLVVWDFE
ncbi:Telomerase Cajal body protein 1 [Vanrija pseudolonga]|uniref:Telomerase Cajal body protein 1 n=1 Tax=Vanrija pseudolonga TaxID=143232 RepID=A0AAF0YDE1_9TREE|nr:Telomerase Cajal body protein 1 [Vanrija pseudolonga]